MWATLKRKKTKPTTTKTTTTFKRVAKAAGIKLLEEGLVQLVKQYAENNHFGENTEQYALVQLIVWCIHNIGGYQTLKMLDLSKRNTRLLKNMITGMKMAKYVSDTESPLYKALDKFTSNQTKNTSTSKINEKESHSKN